MAFVGAAGAVRAAYRREAGGPSDFFALQRGLTSSGQGAAELPLAALVGLLRMGAYDAELFYKLRRRMVEAAAGAGPAAVSDAADAVERCWRSYYPEGGWRDLPFEAGSFFLGVGRYARAPEFFELSAAVHGGHHHVVHHNSSSHKVGQWRNRVKHDPRNRVGRVLM